MRISQNMTGMHCSMLSVHPFVYGIGQKADSGHYLSPANAINYLANKIRGTGNMSAVVLMICAKTHNEFIQHLTQFSAVLPLPVFSQVTRMAKTAERLAITKMQLPGKSGSGLPPLQPFSTSTSRMAVNAQLIEQAKTQVSAGSSIAGLKSQLTNFTTVRQNALQQVTAALNGVRNKSTRVWVCSGKGNGVLLAEKLCQDTPEQDAVYTLATLFVGDDISALERMLHNEPNYHTGP
ncbi:hypothetical protein [Photorhabdus bodei]|uniref:Phage protein n=1 Tax=Photorhabdus bodei TaxID=2029681 RepID=A0AAW6BLS0_9GAMM|nr:hypothetical protein [Photorhabdus bodei]MDB6374093.1 hypothetical protein [Photorhabdus bodei]